MIGGVLFYAVGQAKGWDVWRIIYVLCGGVTIVWGVVLMFFLPDNILTAARFTIEERAMLIGRSARNRTGVFSRRIKPAQIKEALVDPQVWLLFWYVLLNECVNGGIANFSKLIVKGFTNDALLTTAYGIPYGATMSLFMFTGPYMASKIKNVRTYVMILWLLPTLTAVVLFWQLPRRNRGGLLAGYYLVSGWLPKQGSLPVPSTQPTCPTDLNRPNSAPRSLEVSLLRCKCRLATLVVTPSGRRRRPLCSLPTVLATSLVLTRFFRMRALSIRLVAK